MEIKMELQEKIVLIQKVDIFKDLAISELAAISEIAREKSFLPDQVLFYEKEFADTMYICVKGRVTTYRNKMEVGCFETGSSFGMSAFLVDSKRLLTCIAQTRTRVLEIHKQEFEEMLMEYPQISYEIAKISTRRIQRLLEHIKKGECQESLLKNFFNNESLM